LENWGGDSQEIPNIKKYPYESNHFNYGGFAMKKSSLFISTILTVFILAVLAGTVTAYRAVNTNVVAAQQPTPVVQPTPVALTPEQAAQVAAQYWGRSDLYSVESAMLNGTTAYKVTFSSGDIVYVSPEGQVVSVIAAPVAIPQNNALSFQSAPQVQPSTTFSGGEHEGGEHEGGDD
jgi:hypothetical protein